MVVSKYWEFEIPRLSLISEYQCLLWIGINVNYQNELLHAIQFGNICIMNYRILLLNILIVSYENNTMNKRIVINPKTSSVSSALSLRRLRWNNKITTPKIK